MNKKKFLSFLLAGVLTTTAVTIPVVAYAKANEGAKQPYTPTVTSKEENTMVNLLDGEILEFASNYTKCSADKYAERMGTDRFAPKPFTLTWQAEEGALYYTLKLATKPDFSDEVKYLTFTNEHTFEDLFMGTKYYYQVVAQFENKTVKSRIFTFKTAYLPRTINVGGVSNTRDIGGYYTVDKTHRVRQGMVYRGGMLEDGSADDLRKMLNVYKIKTDLDLRAEKSASPLGLGVNFVNVSAPYYLGRDGINSEVSSSKGDWEGTYREALLKEIQTFAKRENYPIYVHCSLGRDRTGTLVFLINALCGVGEMDLFLDYEISYFSKKWGGDGQTAAYMVGNAFTGLYTYIKNYGKGTLSQNAERFMLDLGVTQTEIDSIRNIMLEEVQA